MSLSRSTGPLARLACLFSILSLTIAEAEPRLARQELSGSFNLEIALQRLPKPGSTPAQVVFHWQPNGDHYVLQMFGDRADLVVTAGKQSKRLHSAPLPKKPPAASKLLLKRHGESITAVLDRSFLLRTKDARFRGGRYGVVPGNAVQVKSIRYQAFAPPEFADDFQRNADEPGPWVKGRGDWDVASLRRPDFSANAFCFRGRGEDALALTGDRFWQDYRFRVAVKPTGRGEFGLIVAAMDASRYLLLRFRDSGRDQCVELVTRNGNAQSRKGSAVPGRLKPGEWHEIGLDVREDSVTAWADGYRMLETDFGVPLHGRVGLFASSEEGVYFDDVRVRPLGANGLKSAGQELAAAGAAPVSGEGLVTDTMAKDKIMQEWSSRHSFWKSDGRTAWHREIFFGDAAIAWGPRGGRIGEGIELLLHTDGKDPKSGYALSIQSDGTLLLRRRDRMVGRKEAPKTPSKATRYAMGWVGGRLTASVDEKEVLVFRDPSPLTRGHPGVHREKGWVDTGEISVFAGNLHDYPFRRAPVDWETGTGDWGVQSRWACTPRWSWFGGRSPMAATIWHRDRFRGDFVIDLVASFRMDSGFCPYYRDPGNICATICADGRNLDSGYTFVYGGWNNTRSCLLRGKHVVAQTTRFLLPRNVDGWFRGTWLHKHWNRVTIRKLGNQVTVFIDREPALEFTDPNPLKGDRLAVWTYDNPMMLARARIHYSELLPRPNPLLPPQTTMPARTAAATMTSRSHPSRQWDFEHGLKGWTNPDGEHGADLAIEQKDGRSALRLTNTHGGGTFAARVGDEPFDVDTFSRMLFDCRIPKGVRVNLYFRSRGTTYFLALTGTKEAHKNYIPLGAAAEVKDDGKWHRANIDLRAAFGREVPFTEKVVVDEMLFADLDDHNYRAAGFQGNRAGATYWLDDVYLGKPGGREIECEWPTVSESLKVHAKPAAKRKPAAKPPLPYWATWLAPKPTGFARKHTKTPLRATKAKLPADGDGERFFHKCVVSPDGVGRIERYRFLVDRTPPTIGKFVPASGTKAAPVAVSAKVKDVGSGVGESTLSLLVRNKRFDLAHPALTYDPVDGTLSLDLAQAAIVPKDGENVEVRVEGVADRLGHKSAPAKWTWKMSRSLDKAGPPAPEVRIQGAGLAVDDFEHGFGEWQAYGGPSGATPYRHPHGATNGRFCLRLVNEQLGGTGGCFIRRTPFNLRKHPFLSFDYRVDKRLRVDLQCRINDQWYTVKFTDNDATFPVIGEIPGVVRDGGWHHAAFDLLQMADRRVGRDEPLSVTGLRFASGGWPGNREGATWYVDNLRIQTALKAGTSIPVELRTGDVSGIAGYSWVLDSNPSTTPPEKTNSAKSRISIKPPPGRSFLHVRACDSRGNWGPPSHQPVVAQASGKGAPPTVAKVLPADKASADGSRMEITLADNGSKVCPADVRLSVAGRMWHVGDPCLKVDAGSGKIVWDGALARVAGQSPRDKTQVECRLHVADLWGNAMARPHRWSWRVDRKLDKTPPSAPFVSYVRSDRFCRDTFEEDTSTWGDFGAAQVVLSRTTSATGSGSAELLSLGSRRSNALIQEIAFSSDRYPVVAFDYRFSRALADRSGRFTMAGVSFDGEHDAWPPFATYVARDDRWHHGEFDLVAAIKRNDPGKGQYEVRRLIVRGPSGHGAEGLAYYVDNFTVASDWGRDPAFEWKDPPDASGIGGYRFVLDTKPDTIPEAKDPVQTHRAEFKGVDPGEYWFHLRACDGAGNWGPATHYRFEIKARPTGAPNPP